jgi:hypothetical protein
MKLVVKGSSPMIPNSGKDDRPEAGIADFAKQHRLRARRDVDGTVVITGRHGHIYQHDNGVFSVLVMPSKWRPRYWNSVKRQLVASGFDIRQDCDAEGAATFAPGDAMQAMVAMKAAGVRPIRIKSAAQLEAARRGLKAAKAAKDRVKSAAKAGLQALGQNASAR